MPPRGLLRHHQVPVRPGGDLRQVGDHQHLVPLRHLRQRAAHLRADLAADALVHLVEHQRGDRVVPGEHHLEREHQARELATGRHPGERLGLEPDVELHVNCTLSWPCDARLGQRRQLDRELPARQPELRQQAVHPARQPVGRLTAALG